MAASDEICARIAAVVPESGYHTVWVHGDLIGKYAARGYETTATCVEDVVLMRRLLTHELAAEEREAAKSREDHLEDMVANFHNHVDELAKG